MTKMKCPKCGDTVNVDEATIKITEKLMFCERERDSFKQELFGARNVIGKLREELNDLKNTTA